jgi:hypothetical protein
VAAADLVPLASAKNPLPAGVERRARDSTGANSALRRRDRHLPPARRGEAGESNAHSRATAGAAPFNRPYPERS